MLRGSHPSSIHHTYCWCGQEALRIPEVNGKVNYTSIKTLTSMRNTYDKQEIHRQVALDTTVAVGELQEPNIIDLSVTELRTPTGQ
jgi:hypothetical protein